MKSTLRTLGKSLGRQLSYPVSPNEKSSQLDMFKLEFDRSSEPLTRDLSAGKNAMIESSNTSVKARAHDTIESLPDEATWDDVLYRVYVRKKIESGLRDVEEGKTCSTSEVRERLGLVE